MKNRVNFLDVTLDLDQDTYEPYTKENNMIKYVHARSNHPHNILKNIPLGNESPVYQKLKKYLTNRSIYTRKRRTMQDFSTY